MKAELRRVVVDGIGHDRLAFACPGCAELLGGDGLHMLPVNTTATNPSWDFDGNLDAPTLSPSILSNMGGGRTCHSFLRAGVFEFLSDCSHSMAGQRVQLPDLPAWFIEQDGATS